MKTKYHLPLAIASLALAANVAHADLREHNVTVSYKLYTEGEEKFDEKDNGYKASQKIEKEKISNKEVLEALVEEGVIDEIKGWKITMLTADSGGAIVGIFLTKKDESPIDISDFFEFDVFFAIEEFKEEEKSKDGDVKYKAKSTILGTGYIDLFIGDFSTSTFSIVKIDSEESYKEKDGDEESEFVTKKASFESTVGEAYDDEEAFGVIEGNLKAGKGKKTDLED